MGCAPFRRLEITDGTTTVNLLAPRSGFYCTDWRPVIVGAKARGVWRDSPLADGRRLAMKKLSNAIERYELQVRSWEPDAVARQTQILRRLLEKAVAYWTARWQDDPVWIIAQSPLETNARYALIHDYSTPRDGFPYDQPFWPQIGSAAFEDFALLLERGHWAENEPGTGTAIETSAVETYDGRNLGNVDSAGDRDETTADEVYFANKRNEANLTDIYYRDPLNAWSLNLMDAALPFAFTPPAPAPGDITYFGIDTSLANSGPFCSLVFDIGTVQVNLTAIAWEYWNGAWVGLTVQDNTDAAGAMGGVAFDTLGVGSVHWRQPSDWATRNLFTEHGGAAPNITGYWVRARITVVAAPGVPPQQQNRDIYSIVWPYAEVQEGQVGGDLPALLRSKIYNESAGPSLSLWSDRIICGLRSMNRGESFTAYINLANDQNPAGITVAPDPTDSAFATDVETPTGRRITYNPAAARALELEVGISFAPAIAPDFYGTYHAFLRLQQVGGDAGDAWAQLWSTLGVSAGNVKMESEVQFTQTTGDWETIDFGQITIPPTPIGMDEVAVALHLDILLGCTDPPVDLYLYDLILIPVDEWSFDAAQILNDDSTTSRVLDYLRYLDADSITRPKNAFRTFVRYIATDQLFTYYRPVNNGPAILQANSKQRLWFFVEKARTDAAPPYLPRYPHPWICHTIQCERCQRYFSLRGNR